MTLADWSAIAQIALSLLTFSTLCILIWYTIETSRLRREAQTQNEAINLPVLVMDFATSDDSKGKSHDLPTVKNIGRGPAFDVTIERLAMKDVVVEFESLPLVEAGAERLVPLTVQEGKSSLDPSIISFLKLVENAALPQTITVKTQCRSLTGTQYSAEHELLYLDISTGSWVERFEVRFKRVTRAWK
jgi:hypothetical protein